MYLRKYFKYGILTKDYFSHATAMASLAYGVQFRVPRSLRLRMPLTEQVRLAKWSRETGQSIPAKEPKLIEVVELRVSGSDEMLNAELN